MKPKVIELVIFKIRPEIKHEDFQKAVEKSTKALQKMNGFLHRELGVTDNEKEWTDIVYWSDDHSALKASELFEKEPDAQEFLNMLDEKTIKMLHLNILHNTDLSP